MLKQKNVLFISITLCIILSACSKQSDFDAKSYVQSSLDACYHGEYADYANFLEISEKDAKKEIEEDFNERIRQQFDDSDNITEEGITVYNEKMAEVIAKAKLPSCLMHNRETVEYNNFLEDVVSDLQETLNIAKKAGISKDTIILDPGVGFAKNYEQNLAITNHLEVLDTLGCPVLLGTSRKSMIGLTLDLPSDQREEGTMVTTVWAVQKGCMFVRVHNVQANVRAIKMAEALLRN